MSSSQVFRLNSLVSVDFSELQRAMEWIINQVKQHDEKLNEVRNVQSSMKETIMQNTNCIKDLQVTAVTFNRGLDDLNIMKDKLASWSERFRILEEKHLNCMTLVNQNTEDLQEQIDEVNAKLSRDTESLINTLREELNNAILSEENRSNNIHTDLKQQLETTKTENQNSVHMLEKGVNSKISYLQGLLSHPTEITSEAYQSKTENNERTIMKTGSDVIEVTQENTRGVMVLKDKVTSLESIITNLMKKVEEGQMNKKGYIPSNIDDIESTPGFIQEIYRRITGLEINFKSIKEFSIRIEEEDRDRDRDLMHGLDIPKFENLQEVKSYDSGSNLQISKSFQEDQAENTVNIT